MYPNNATPISIFGGLELSNFQLRNKRGNSSHYSTSLGIIGTLKLIEPEIESYQMKSNIVQNLTVSGFPVHRQNITISVNFNYMPNHRTTTDMTVQNGFYHKDPPFE